MSLFRTFVFIALLIFGTFALTHGCQSMPSADPAAPDLTDADKQAVDTALASSDALARSTATAQSGVNIPQTNGQQIDTTFGSCPVTTTQVSTEGGVNLDLTLDFGTGCNPFGSGYTCSGSASGSLSQQDRRIDLFFSSISCNNGTLTGALGANYEITDMAVGLTGDWVITLSDQDAVFTTYGAGTGSHDRTGNVTTIATFNGTISDGISSWNAAITDLLMSAAQNGSFIPFGGTIALTDPESRTLTIRFNETSPSTGDVEVSINGGPFLPYNLSSL